MEVVVAIIKKHDKILCCQRKSDDKFPGKWEFPGGKVNEGEPLSIALERELNEELGETRINDLKMMDNFQSHYGDEDYNVFVYSVDIESNFELNVHNRIKWVSGDELGKLNWLDGNTELVEKLSKLDNGYL